MEAERASILDLQAGEHAGVRGAFVGERIRLPMRPDRIASNPAVYAIGASRLAAVFRYGVVVFFNTSDEDEQEFMAELGDRIVGRFDVVEEERTTLLCEPDTREGLSGNQITVHRATAAHFQSVADVLAKSVVLAHYERELATVFEAVEPITTAFREGRTGRTSKLLDYIGRSLEIQQRMVGRVEVSEKPELLWERPELDRLYLLLAKEFELRDRSIALERKLAVISNTAETLLDLVQTRRSLRVEWYIVFLIVIEIALSLAAWFA